MTKYTVKKLASKLYRDSYQNNNGYHEIFYNPEKDELEISFMSHNNWSSDQTNRVGTMAGRIRPTQAFEIAAEILGKIRREELALKELENDN